MGAITSALGQGYDSRAIANHILEVAHARGQNLTIMQLVKLIYFAQGWYLAFVGKPITSDKAQAWQYGPVYPKVYKAFPGAGASPLDGVIQDRITGEAFKANLTEDEAALIEWVVDQYGSLHAFDLSRRTHSENGPWQTAMDRGGTYSEISDADMQSYFRQFVKHDAK